ncbi:unnamed protein product [Chrysodeixis includens]|uniref:Uncharacterized protein n=1 Tax=Chrysodeixis includens TaxID=689277 RepID=A0A9N8PZ06_CHRIL|nr:unnamed protein product [Chrysodeixis includens]
MVQNLVCKSTYKEASRYLLQSPRAQQRRAEEHDTRSYYGNGKVDEWCSHSGCREEGRRVLQSQRLPRGGSTSVAVTAVAERSFDVYKVTNACSTLMRPASDSAHDRLRRTPEA